MKTPPPLIRAAVARRLAREAAAEFGVPARRVSRQWLADMEAACVRFVRLNAVSSTGDRRKTIGKE